MKLEYSIEEIIDMIKTYFREYEGREWIEVTFSRGKVVTGKKYMPKRNVISFSVFEGYFDDDNIESFFPLPVPGNFLETIINVLLEEKNLGVDSIDYTLDSVIVDVSERKMERMRTPKVNIDKQENNE